MGGEPPLPSLSSQSLASFLNLKSKSRKLGMFFYPNRPLPPEARIENCTRLALSLNLKRVKIEMDHFNIFQDIVA